MLFDSKISPYVWLQFHWMLILSSSMELLPLGASSKDNLLTIHMFLNGISKIFYWVNYDFVFSGWWYRVNTAYR